MHYDAQIAIIRAAHRKRQFMIKQRIRSENALLAFIRTDLGWRADLPEKESKAIRAKAMQIADDPTEEYAELVAATREGQKSFIDVEEKMKKAMVKAAKNLPGWKEFGNGVLGFGMPTFAELIGEAGDLGAYSRDGLRKRFGLAPYCGRAPSTWRMRGGLTAEQWTELGYKPSRLAIVYASLGTNLVKNKSCYRAIYDARKAYEMQRDPDMSKGHAHKRAMRFMEQKFIGDLRNAWIAAVSPPGHLDVAKIGQMAGAGAGKAIEARA